MMRLKESNKLEEWNSIPLALTEPLIGKFVENFHLPPKLAK